MKCFQNVRKLAVASALGVAMNSQSHASLSNSLYELATFGQTMGTFTNSLNQLLHSRSPQEQQEIQQRLSYVEQQATMQAYALETFIAADEALANSANGWTNYFGMGGDDAAIEQVYRSFKQYQSLFSPHILRATGQFPMTNYERLYIRWKQTPATNPSQKEYAKQQFMSVFRQFARSFVYQSQEQLNRKRQRFLSALRKVERSGPFAMSDKTDFDKAFWDYQSMFSNMVEPQYGQVFLPEFPYNQALTSQQQPNFVYNQSVYTNSGLNQFGYGSTTGMGYQLNAGMGMGTGYSMNTGYTGGMMTGSSAFATGRYSASNTVQSNQVVPLGGTGLGTHGSQLSSPYGAFAPSTSENLDAELRQQMFMMQKQYERSSNSGSIQDVEKSYQDYMNLRDQWFGN